MRLEISGKEVIDAIKAKLGDKLPDEYSGATLYGDFTKLNLVRSNVEGKTQYRKMSVVLSGVKGGEPAPAATEPVAPKEPAPAPAAPAAAVEEKTTKKRPGKGQGNGQEQRFLDRGSNVPDAGSGGGS